MRTPRGDDGLLFIGLLIRVLVTLAVLGVVGFDAGSVILTRNKLEDTAGLAAAEAARVYAVHPDSTAAYQAAKAVAQAGGSTLAPTDFSVSKGGTVTVTLRGDATTLVLGRLPRTDDLTHPTTTATHKVGG